MKTCAIRLKCEGDEKHSQHTETVMLVVFAESPDEVDTVEALRLALCLVEPPENIFELRRDLDGIKKITEAMKLVLVATQPDEDEKVFDEVNEVDLDVDFLG